MDTTLLNTSLVGIIALLLVSFRILFPHLSWQTTDCFLIHLDGTFLLLCVPFNFSNTVCPIELFLYSVSHWIFLIPCVPMNFSYTACPIEFFLYRVSNWTFLIQCVQLNVSRLKLWLNSPTFFCFCFCFIVCSFFRPSDFLKSI